MPHEALRGLRKTALYIRKRVIFLENLWLAQSAQYSLKAGFAKESPSLKLPRSGRAEGELSEASTPSVELAARESTEKV
jgi:hypothetical protein